MAAGMYGAIGRRLPQPLLASLRRLVVFALHRGSNWVASDWYLLAVGVPWRVDPWKKHLISASHFIEDILTIGQLSMEVLQRLWQASVGPEGPVYWLRRGLDLLGGGLRPRFMAMSGGPACPRCVAGAQEPLSGFPSSPSFVGRGGCPCQGS